jgi:sugar phosphate isomerase/epimerase
MKKHAVSVLAAIALAALATALPAQKAKAPDKTIPAQVVNAVAAADYAKVRIKEFPVAVQCWTYRKFSFFETLDKVKALGVRFIQAYPGQPLGKALPKAVFGPEMSEDQVRAVKDGLAASGLRIVAYGVCEIGTTEVEMRKAFDFVRKMDIPVLVCEPGDDDYTLLDKLAGEYDVRVAVHNHPEPAKYAYPGLLVKNLAGRSRLIGSCFDPGHFMRGGLKPIECLKYLEGRIIDVHLKDRSDFGVKNVVDTAVGDGKVGLRDILAELTLQDYDGYLTFEYENEKMVATPEPAIRKSLENIKALTTYAGYAQIFHRGWGGYEKYGWNHYGPGYFEVDSVTGILKGHGGMGLLWYSEKTYRDFVLECDFMCASKDTNSGIFIHVPGVPTSDDYIYHSFEIQVWDAGEGVHATGAVYDVQAASPNASLPPGKWNHIKITCRGRHIVVDLNDKTVVNWDAVPGGKVRDFAAEGYIGFQNHDSIAPIFFRNIFIKEI